MPLIKIDYDEQLLDKSIKELVKLLLGESMRIYNLGEDYVSIFTAGYGSNYFSTSAAEIEVRAKISEYIRPNISTTDLRVSHLGEYKKVLDSFVKKHNLPKGIIFTITFEDWQVELISPANV